jgi:hypothetical protein
MLSLRRLDRGGLVDAGNRLMMLAARGEVAPHPAQKRMIAVVRHVIGAQARRIMKTDQPATLLHHPCQVFHHSWAVRHLRGREAIAAEHHRRDFLEPFAIGGPGHHHFGLDAVDVLRMFQAVLDQPSPRAHFMGSRRMIAGPDQDQHLRLRGRLLRQHLAGAQRDCGECR